MFLTVVLACSISIPTECQIFEDTYGPYATYKECAERAEVMRESILEISAGDMEPVQYRCDKIEVEPDGVQT